MRLWQQAFERHLKDHFGEKLELVWTQNRRLMINYHEKKGVPTLRLHESFGTAGNKVKEDLVYYLTHPRVKVPKTINEFVREISKASEPDKKQKSIIRHAGENFDLKNTYQKLNKIYFDGKLSGEISWGRKVFGKKSSIVFGSYYIESKLIRIHPVLDTELVPPFYIESVVYHEMIHEYLQTFEPEHSGMHPPRFRELEKAFKFHQLAAAWEKSHISKLLNYNPSEKIAVRK